jgi:hypothetical protein
MRGEAKVTLPKAYCISLPCDPRCEHALLLYECFFDFVFRFACDGWQNRAMCLHQVLREAFGEHPLSRTEVFEWHTHFKMTNVQGDQAPTERQKMFKKFENSSTKTVAGQSMGSQTPLGSVMEFARRP